MTVIELPDEQAALKAKAEVWTCNTCRRACIWPDAEKPTEN
jgi:hypothetical protein